jgi:hypothetical protein
MKIFLVMSSKIEIILQSNETNVHKMEETKKLFQITALSGAKQFLY